MAKLLKTLGCFQHRQHTVRMRLRIELIGIAHHLFLQLLRLKAGQPCTRMALGNTSMALPSKVSQQLAANLTMTEIRLRAITEDARGISPADTYIV